MCGRFVLQSAVEIISQIFRLCRIEATLTPRYNVAPGQDIAIVVEEASVRSLASCRWGFLPDWAKDPSDGHKMINARAETVAEKPAFRRSFLRHRCLVVADGFYEWRTEGGKKTPVYIRLRSGRPMGFAGIFNRWTGPDGVPVCTTAIITIEANDLVRPLHDRMPAIALPDRYDLWLDPGMQDRERLQAVLAPFPAALLEAYEVTSNVNSPKNDSPENIERIRKQ
jgi:putative SOS response-associated peptidase YedK